MPEAEYDEQAVTYCFVSVSDFEENSYSISCELGDNDLSNLRLAFMLLTTGQFRKAKTLAIQAATGLEVDDFNGEVTSAFQANQAVLHAFQTARNKVELDLQCTETAKHVQAMMLQYDIVVHELEAAVAKGNK